MLLQKHGPLSPERGRGLGRGGLALLLLVVFSLTPAMSEVTSEEARVLGGPLLTPLGATRAGNAEGTIPPWTGGITEPPAGYQPGKHHMDPFADDTVLFTITAANLAEHADKLSEGQKALLRTYPDSWRMNIYPTRRSASYPEWVYAAVKRNATVAQVIPGGKGGVANANVSSPFPIPRNGLEMVWNHNLRWRGIRVSRSFGEAAVTRRGRYTVIMSIQEWGFPYGMSPDSPLRTDFPNLLFAIKSKVIQPGLIAGDGVLVLEPIDQSKDPRKSWIYDRNTRRILRVPYLADGYPALNADGLRTVDEFDMYNGAPDLFEWKLLGKRELYIPYNAYRLHSGALDYDDIIKPKHINPDPARYELHRVWVVEGTLKPGARHMYARRTFYIDEDSWQIAVTDTYDKYGALWRAGEAHALNYYQVPVLWSTLEVYYDLKQQRYLVSGIDNRRNPYQFTEDADPREFSPNALNYYIR